MNKCMPYVLKDISDSLWKFYINEKQHLICHNSYEKTQIDENVLEFDVNINYLGTIQLIYITYDGNVKYCEFNKKWTTQTLYSLCNKGDKIQEIKIHSIDGELHIFFIFLKEGNEYIGDILHYKWSGNKFYTNIVSSINLNYFMNNHYEVEILNNKLYLFFLEKERDEISLNICKYQENTWSNTEKLYRLSGTDIEFSVIKKDNIFHIINLTKENNRSILEHVAMDENQNMRAFKIHEGNDTIYEPTILIENNTIYSMWIENNSLMYSSFNNTWCNPSKIIIENINEVEKSKYISEEDSKTNLNIKQVFILSSSNPKIFLPEETLIYGDIEEKKHELLENCDAEKTIQKLLKELSLSKILNNKLEKRISLLKGKLQEKEITLNNFNEYLNQTITQKRKVEKDYNLLLQSQTNYTNEVENIKKELNIERNNAQKLQQKLKELVNENEQLKNNVSKIKEFENALEKITNEKLKCQTSCKHIEDLKFKLMEKENENNIIREELENYKNKSFIEKFFGSKK